MSTNPNQFKWSFIQNCLLQVKQTVDITKASLAIKPKTSKIDRKVNDMVAAQNIFKQLSSLVDSEKVIFELSDKILLASQDKEGAIKDKIQRALDHSHDAFIQGYRQLTDKDLNVEDPEVKQKLEKLKSKLSMTMNLLRKVQFELGDSSDLPLKIN